jgi:hypothetical protein
LSVLYIDNKLQLLKLQLLMEQVLKIKNLHSFPLFFTLQRLPRRTATR